MTSVLVCTICKERYNSTDRKPYLLECSHTFCYQCIFRKIEGGIITCSDCNLRAIFDKENPKFNKVISSEVEQVEVICEMNDGRPSDNKCNNCFIFICSECTKFHSCNPNNIVSLTDIDVKQTIINKINRERYVILESPITDQESEIKSCSQLLSMLRSEQRNESSIKCKNHPTLSGEFLNLDDLHFYCKPCKTRTRSAFIEFSEKEAILSKLREALFLKLQRDSFSFSPVLLSCLRIGGLKEIMRILKNIREGLNFIPCCLICSRRLDSSNAVRYPCEPAHLICNQCIGENTSITCLCDNRTFLVSECQETQLEPLFKFVPKCPLCMKRSDLVELPICAHSFCSECVLLLNNCPICFTNLRGQNLSELDEDRFIKRIQTLPCSSSDGNVATKITVQTCRLYCESCSSDFSRAYYFEDISIFLPTFLTTRLYKTLSEITKTKSDAFDYNSKIIECKRNFRHPSATPELMELLDRYPQVSLVELAELLYYLKADCTDCDQPQKHEPCGWRLPHISLKYVKTAMRFNSVVPPQFCSNFEPNRKPWKIEEGKSQVELVGLVAYDKIKLRGIVLSTSLGPDKDKGSLEYLEIYTTKFSPEFGDIVVSSSSCELLYRHNRSESLNVPGNFKPVLFSNFFILEAGDIYLLKLKLHGKSFYSGNPYTSGETPTFTVGSDGRSFRFIGCLNVVDDEYVYESNENMGPLLGIIYA